MRQIEFALPEYAADLFQPHRYKVLWGGRGSAKSYTVTRALLSIGMQRPCRVLCGREYQNSIADSVHHLLASQIEECGLSAFYDVQQQRILGANGTEFIFKGVKHNIQSIKSLSKVTHLWLEEAQTVSAESWEVLIPTIREPGSEIWATFNPDLETDPTYQKFVANEPPPGSFVRRVNWDQNPWFPAELNAERTYLQRVDPDAYAHVWGGHCRSRSDAQVLKDKISVEAFEPGEGWNGPYYGADWGFAEDPTALVRLWVHDRCLWVEHEAWGIGVETDHLPAFFDRVPGARLHVIRADSARPETISYLQRAGFRVIPAKKGPGSVEDGVAHLRSYERIVIHPRCVHAIEEARLWSYKTDKLTGDVLPALKPGSDHCIAAGELVTTARGDVPIEQVIAGDLVMTRNGWRAVMKSWQASPRREVWKVMAGGRSLIATPDHEVFTVGRGFVRVDALRSDDVLLVSGGSTLWQEMRPALRQLSIAVIRIGDTLIAKARLIGTILKGRLLERVLNIYTSGSISNITARSSKAHIFTTLTETQGTIHRETWNASKSQSILENIGQQSGSRGTGNSSTGSVRLQRNGIRAMKAEKFIAELADWLTRALPLSRRSASNAVKTLRRAQWDTMIYFAATHASLHGGGIQGSMTRSGIALFVDASSSLTNTKSARLVRCRVEAVSPMKEERPVYDLSVADCHEFIASGVLVSNCWDAARYGLEPLIRSRQSPAQMLKVNGL